MRLPNWIEDRLYLWSKALFVRAITRGKNKDLKEIVNRAITDVEIVADDAFTNREAEIAIIEARLMRLYDPAQAFNEAVLRAIAAKKAKREELYAMSAHQQMAFDVQRESLTKALRSA